MNNNTDTGVSLADLSALESDKSARLIYCLALAYPHPIPAHVMAKVTGITVHWIRVKTNALTQRFPLGFGISITANRMGYAITDFGVFSKKRTIADARSFYRNCSSANELAAYLSSSQSRVSSPGKPRTASKASC